MLKEIRFSIATQPVFLRKSESHWHRNAEFRLVSLAEEELGFKQKIDYTYNNPLFKIDLI